MHGVLVRRVHFLSHDWTPPYRGGEGGGKGGCFERELVEAFFVYILDISMNSYLSELAWCIKENFEWGVKL